MNNWELLLIKKELDFINDTIDQLEFFSEMIVSEDNNDDWLNESKIIVGWLKMISLSVETIQLNLTSIANKCKNDLTNEIKQFLQQWGEEVMRIMDVCQKTPKSETINELAQIKDANYVEFCDRIDMLQSTDDD